MRDKKGRKEGKGEGGREGGREGKREVAILQPKQEGRVDAIWNLKIAMPITTAHLERKQEFTKYVNIKL